MSTMANKRIEDSAIAVRSYASTDNIISSGGAGAWVLNPDKASQQTFLICCKPIDEVIVPGGPAYAAFLIGRISKFIPVETNPRNQRRFHVALDNYATLDAPLPWQDWRNPIRYTSLEEIGIHPERLSFHEISAPERTESIEADVPRRIRKLSLADAKQGLAAMFDVDPSKIEIIIKS